MKGGGRVVKGHSKHGSKMCCELDYHAYPCTAARFPSLFRVEGRVTRYKHLLAILVGI